MSDWKPGAVAAVTIKGQRNLLAVRLDRGLTSATWATAIGRPHHLHEDKAVEDARPLVIIDPADDAQIARLARAYVQAYQTLPWGGVDADDQVRACMRVALLHEANAEGGVA